MFSIEFKLIIRNILASASASTSVSSSVPHLSFHLYAYLFTPFQFQFQFILCYSFCCCLFLTLATQLFVLFVFAFALLLLLFICLSAELLGDGRFAVRFLFLLIAIVAWLQLFQHQGGIRLTLVGLLLQHCPVIDVVILMVQRSEQNAKRIIKRKENEKKYLKFIFV